MPWKPMGIAGPNFLVQAATANAHRTVNLYPKLLSYNERQSSVILLPTPGYNLFADLGTALPVRGVFSRSDQKLIAVSGTKVFTVTSGGAVAQQTGLISNS